MYWISLIIALLVWAFLAPVACGLVAWPITALYRVISRDQILHPSHPAEIAALSCGAVLLATLTAQAWRWGGLAPDWSLWVPVLACQVLVGISAGANKCNIATAWAGIIGVTIYWIIS